ncbi:MAG: hypothetical protein EPGJADBJ_02527 [Saprospiraceae bacterium]|nr:hypothetical protein [Saprospiraceae bacterium]
MTSMIRLLRHGYYLLHATVWLALAFARAGFYFKTKALHDLALPNPEALTSKEKRRLKHYFYGTTYLSAVFCMLRGYPRSRNEKHLFTNLAALAYFFDDLVDAFRGRDDSGILWQNNPEQYGRAADPRGLALHFLQNIYNELPPASLMLFKEFMHRVFNVETAERQNGDGRLRMADHGWRMADLERITAEKGGFSVLLFRRVLAHPLEEAEQEALFQFGYLVQLCDDIFDLWHDRQSKTVTLATFFAERNDISGLRNVFENQVDVVKKAFALNPGSSHTAREAPANAPERSPAPFPPGEVQGVGSKRGRSSSLAAIHFLVSITRVCLRHYADLQKKHGTLPLDDRAAMVVDMERWANRTRAILELVRAH